MKNVNNVKDEEENLISVYGSIKLSEHYTLFARHDDVSETSEYGTYTIYGLERKMAKGVTIALNMQSWTDSSDGAEAENTLYLKKCSFGLNLLWITLPLYIQELVIKIF